MQCIMDVQGVRHWCELNERLFIGFPKNDQELTVPADVAFGRINRDTFDEIKKTIRTCIVRLGASRQ